MKLEVQRRAIRIGPPRGGDLDWLAKAIDQGGLWLYFGWPSPFGEMIKERQPRGELIVGVVRKDDAERPIGFALVFPPTGLGADWEVLFAIPDPSDRDGFTAIQAFDGLLYYLFDRLGFEALIFRTRQDNRPALAAARRMGFQPEGLSPLGSAVHALFRIDRSSWAARKAKLARSDAEPFRCADCGSGR